MSQNNDEIRYDEDVNSFEISSEENKKNYLLIIFVIVSFIFSAFMFLKGGGADIPPEALETPEYGLPIIDEKL